MSRPSRALVAATLLALVASCGGETPPPALEELQRPVLDRLEASVRTQIETALEAVESLPAAAPAPEKGKAWGALGRLYDAYEFPAAAATCYRNARALAPEELQWHYYSGRLARAAGDLTAADAALAAALAVDGGDPAVRAELGRLRLDQRRLEEAAEVADALVADDPASAAGLLLRAQVAVERRDWRQARSDYERLLVLQPGADRLHRLLAVACRELGDGECARGHLALEGSGGVRLEDPYLATLTDLRSGVNSVLDEALTLYQEGDFESAEKLFAEAVALDPGNARAHLDRGSALKELGRLEEALAQFDEALRLQPTYAKALYNRGVVLAAQGDDAAALAAYEQTLELDPRHGEARFNRANALRRLGRPAEALAAYSDLVAEDPANGRARLGRAVALLDLGRDGEALAALEESDRLFPRSPTFKNLIARVLVTSADPQVRDPARGLVLAQRLAMAAPTVEHVETLAMAQAAVGDFQGAITNLERTLAELKRTGRSEAGTPLARRLEELRAGRPPRDPGID
ncbi:MAG: tetratricopeptide repeat protein [Acidobacteriota bacterium]|nr:tetratricopeptide repeat protein [Acidobacteriota bacterium]